MIVEPLWIARVIYGRRGIHSHVSAETIRVDGACYLEALSLLGDAWELRAFIQYRAVVGYVANVEPPPLELRAWIAGRAAWGRCGDC